MDLEKINKKFRTFGKKIIKYRWLILILFFFVLIFSLFGLSGLEKDSSNDA